MEVTAAVKSVAGLIFAGQVILFTIVGSFLGLPGISFAYIWQALAIAAITGILHYAAFAENNFRNLKYPVRLTIFAAPVYMTLTVFAVAFKWFPLGVNAWIIFTAIFMFVFGIFITAFEIYAKVTGKRYNELLNAYNNKGDKVAI